MHKILSVETNSLKLFYRDLYLPKVTKYYRVKYYC